MTSQRCTCSPAPAASVTHLGTLQERVGEGLDLVERCALPGPRSERLHDVAAIERRCLRRQPTRRHELRRDCFALRVPARGRRRATDELRNRQPRDL
jgi:hypothetical protein